MLTIYTISHFLVDFASGWVLFHGAAYTDQGLTCLILYNFLAFAMQMPLGWLADRYNHNAVVAAWGCLLVGSACLMPPIPLAITILAGLGNALFHLGGGIDVLNSSCGKNGPLGIFVSTGAWGIFYGSRLGQTAPHLRLLLLSALLAAATAILLQQYSRHRSWLSSNPPRALPKCNILYVLATLCLLGVVIGRSYLGLTMTFSWQELPGWGILALCALAAGKFCGGIVADKFGASKTCIITLGAAALLFLFSTHPLIGVIAILLFNMTMPITLGALSSISPNCKGTAFGTLTLGIFVGALPELLNRQILPSTPLTYTILALGSLVVLYTGLRNCERYRTNYDDNACL